MGYVAAKFQIPGASGLSIVRAAIAGGFYLCETQPQVNSANKANGNGYLTRDAQNGKLFYPTERATEMLAYLAERDAERAAGEAVLAATNPHALATIEDLSADELIVSRADASDLVQTIIRARSLLDEGDVIAAKHLAVGAYLDAKARAQYAASFGDAGKRVIAKARQLQGDALLIETRAKIQIANAYDQAQADGRAATKGRPKNVAGDDIFTQADAGLTRQEIHEARKLAAAEEKAPGLVERAIAARLTAGLEPSRANLRAAVGTATATKEERGNNLYETPQEAMWTLLALESFSPTVWEPACGRGAISRMLEGAGYGVILRDLVDYGTATKDGELQEVEDFLQTVGFADPADIVTNPPYGEFLNAFVAHALRVHKPEKMALLLNVNFFGGTESDDRNFAMDENPPARVYWFARRLPMMHRDGWDGPEAQSRMNTAWFVWERKPMGDYGDRTTIKRVDWKDYVPAEGEAA